MVRRRLDQRRPDFDSVLLRRCPADRHVVQKHSRSGFSLCPDIRTYGHSSPKTPETFAMPGRYHIKHPKNKSIISGNSPNEIVGPLEKSEDWQPGRYKVFKPTPPDKVEEDYVWGFAIKDKDGDVVLEEEQLP